MLSSPMSTLPNRCVTAIATRLCFSSIERAIFCSVRRARGGYEEYARWVTVSPLKESRVQPTVETMKFSLLRGGIVSERAAKTMRVSCESSYQRTKLQRLPWDS